ncbi:MAG: threonine--tRNA ligase [Candidatus Dormibacteria bacterium]
MPDDVVEDAHEGGLPVAGEVTLDVLRHSAAHLMAAAVVELFPGAQYDVGPSIEDGFFYNFRLNGGARFTEDDLAVIEQRMHELSARAVPYRADVLARDEARALFEKMAQPFKVAIIDRLGDGVDRVSVYRTGDFIDLCRGPHVADSAQVRAFKLQRVAGVYWRGDERNEQLQRVYGTAWFSDEDLAAYLHRIEEARRRDHRRLGQELDLFSFPEELGSGLAVFHPTGGLIRKLMEDYSRERHAAAGYEFVNTPHITKEDLFKISGHLDWFSEGMFPPLELDEGARYYLKPMNCPMHILIFRSRTRSYRELPLRLFEFGTVYRYEMSGVVHGLTRARGFTQDDAHIFCSREQMGAELISLLDFTLGLLRDYGLSDFYLELSTKPEGKAVGTEDEWQEATDALRTAASGRGLELVLDPGGGTFYGPKISVQVRDAIGRTWQISTIQVDLQLPQRFGLEFVDASGAAARPVMIHRALFGSIERFFAILVEHYAGAFPLWLAPVQCELIPVQDDNPDVLAAIRDLQTRMGDAGVRVHLGDHPGERMQARIRSAELRKVPYAVVIGKRDVERGDGVVTVRDIRRGGAQQQLATDELIGMLTSEARERRPE